MKSESIKQITAAIISVMNEVKGIDKTMDVGTGANQYKGVADQEVKKIIGAAMVKNGLAIIPLSTETKTQVDRWEEETQYGKKQKQSVFTEVETSYLLMHTSGEYLTISGYGHGVDTQDKGAGKATTYALKYALLYTFMVPTGKIDDTDKDHSEDKEVPKTTAYNHKRLEQNGLPLITNSQFKKLIERIESGDYEAGEKAKKMFSFESNQFSLLNEKLKATI